MLRVAGKRAGGGPVEMRQVVFDHVAGRPLEDDVTLVLAERGA